MSEPSLVGQTIGRFEILSELGRGGMAVVYKARQTDLDRIIALKVLPQSLTVDQSYVARFRQEARSAAQLEHPHIMPIYEVGEVAGYHYIAMKYIQGRTLKQLLEQEGALPVKRAAQILAQVGEALDYAHRQGIIHRDIKPSNVMITDEGWIYLTDFGLARGMGGNTSGLTVAGTVMGTPEYMSPEQAQGLPNVGPPTDIYALGVMLYELLTGAFPFKAETPMAMLAARLVHAPIPPRDVRTDLPPAVEDVIMRALARKPEARFASAGELVAALRNAVGMSESELSRPLTPLRGMPTPGVGQAAWSGYTPTAPATPPPGYAPTAPATPPPVYAQTPMPPTAQPYQAAPPNPLNVPALPPRAAKGAPLGIIAGVGALLLLVLVGGAVFWFLNQEQPPQVSPAAQWLADGDKALLRAGGMADAIAAYRSAIEADPSNLTAQTRLAWALLANADWPEAITAAEPLVKASDPQAQATGHSIIGYSYLQLGNMAEARAASDRASAIDAATAIGYALRAAVLASEAADRRDDAVMNDAFASIGEAEDRLSNTDPLERAFAQALLGAAFAQEHYLRGDPNVLEQAITSLEQAIDAYPALAFFHYELASIYVLASDYPTARSEFAAAIDLDPQYSPAQAGIGIMDYLANDSGAARSALNKALELDPNQSQALFGLGRLAFDEGDWAQAIDYFQLAVDANPHLAIAHAYLGEANLFAGYNSQDAVQQDNFYRNAESAYRAAIARSPFMVFAHNGLGWILQYQGRYAESVAAFNQARQIDDSEAEIFNGLGWSLFFLDRYSEAEEHFKRAIELLPSYASAYFGLGRVYEEQGRRAEALQAFQEVKRLKPDYADIDAAIARVSR